MTSKEYWKLFRPLACSVALKGLDQEGIFDEILNSMLKAKVLSPDQQPEALQALLARERTASTGIGRNVAIPHVKLSGLTSAVVSLAVHPVGVDWRALDGEPTRIFFTVLRPAKAGDEHDPERHLDMMRWISNLSRDEDFRRFALSARTRKDLVDLLKEKSAV